MPENLLLTGPAGASKSQAARELLRNGKADLAADFTSILAGLLLLERDPETGRFPPRDQAAERLIPLVAAIKAAVVREALDRGLTVVETNSNGSPAQRQRLLAALGGGVERILDPGRQVVEQRLADPVTSQLSSECKKATGRYYDNL